MSFKNIFNSKKMKMLTENEPKPEQNHVPTCVECEDQFAEVNCHNCEENFCLPCFDSLHRKGKRKYHFKEKMIGSIMPIPKQNSEIEKNTENDMKPIISAAENDADLSDELEKLRESCKYIPLRLTKEERKLLHLLESTLHVSEYTNRVDIYTRRKERIIHDEIETILTTMSGLAIAGKIGGGESLVNGSLLIKNKDFFAKVFEVGRRYKISNPDKMRDNYGKMMFMLQDAVNTEIFPELVIDIKMVSGYLEEHKGSEILNDQLILAATNEFTGKNLTRREVDNRLQLKKNARKALIDKYAEDESAKEAIELVIDSISDANNYVECNAGIVKTTLQNLRDNFSDDKIEQPYSLELRSSWRIDFSRYRSNAKLNHDHPTQFRFVEQSLMLWDIAMESMFKLWYAADEDLLRGRASYRLCNTGQGLNRVQYCPTVSSEMSKILKKVQRQCSGWVGLSVVHLGDRDVPNALTFIDKYTNIPWILGPINDTLEAISSENSPFYNNSKFPGLEKYIDYAFESKHDLRMKILSDYFKHGFDGDGDDGGSCIDGRLTSTWNWCNLIAKKDYYSIFMLSGFTGFTGPYR